MNILKIIFFPIILLILTRTESYGQQVSQDSVPVYPDIFYEYRFAGLEKKTPVSLEYNPLVRKYIDKYTQERRQEVCKELGLSKLYFPIFEYYLDKYDLPLELKYLAVVESGLDPQAKSSSGAVGLWQFLLNSSKMFDLKVDSYIDERCDVYKSTDAACRYFKYLFQTFNDWNLVLAAYNGGPGVVRNAIERSGGKTNLWDLLPFLPEQTQNYIPAFLAINYLFTFAGDHNLFPVRPEYTFNDIDTVFINYEINFSQIAANIQVSMAELKFLNPQYKLNIIPETGNRQNLVLPARLVNNYLVFENKILSTIPDDTINNKNNHLIKTNYIVKKGDFLHKIAMNFNCSLSELKTWNKLTSDSISPGQVLIIWGK
jgi:membrane-bound lytic murein transglycosylase D